MKSALAGLSARRRTYLLCLTVLMIATTCAQANTSCVSDAGTLQAALTAASDGGANANEDNTIQIVVGTYLTANNGNTEFYYNNQTTNRKLDVNGGYNSDCSINTENPELTVLDGNNETRVFESESNGDVSLRYLTFQKGSVGASEVGGGVLMNKTIDFSGPVIFDQNIVRNNYSAYQSGGLGIGMAASGTLQFENNLIVGNSAASSFGAGVIIDQGSGANIINNTFAQNTVTNMPASGIGGLFFYVKSSATSPPPDTMSNSIFWDNSGYDLNTKAVLVDNDFGWNLSTMDPTSSGNITVDPQFASSSDFHLLPTSPLLGIGTLTRRAACPVSILKVIRVCITLTSTSAPMSEGTKSLRTDSMADPVVLTGLGWTS